MLIMENKKYKVLFLGGGFMGEEAERVLKTIDTIELIILGEQAVKDFDFLLSVSYPHRIDLAVYSQAKVAAINLHSGALPKQRGYHPLNWALIWGDKIGGVTLHKTAESIDSGDIIIQYQFEI